MTYIMCLYCRGGVPGFPCTCNTAPPWYSPMIDPQPRQDMQLPPPAGYISLAAHERAVQEAVARETERCARIAWESEDVYGSRGMNDMAKCARNIAAAIRARKETP
jgi:hypothetical protein